MNDRIATREAVGVVTIVLAMLATASASTIVDAQPTEHTASRDSAAVVALEQKWLAAASDSVVLNEILAADFVYALPTGQFINKAEHIGFVAHHVKPPTAHSRFEQLDVRVYGSTAVATGIVDISTDGVAGVNRTVFTDVFLRRGRSVGE